MRGALETIVLMGLTRNVLHPTDPEPTELDDFYDAVARTAASGDRGARDAIRESARVLAVLDRAGPAVAALAGNFAVANRERARWEEIADGARARLAGGAPVVVYRSRSRAVRRFTRKWKKPPSPSRTEVGR